MQTLFHELEMISQRLVDIGMEGIADRISAVAEGIRLNSIIESEPVNLDDITKLLAESDKKLHLDIFAILESYNPATLLQKNPGMESKAIEIASSMILSKGIDLTDFKKSVTQIVSDANDEAIFNLLDFS
jgi:hypothetical protein